MKKLLTVLLAAAIAASSCISLASCSDDKKEKKEETSTTVEATVNKEEEDQATKDEADDSEADLMMLHGVSSEPQNDFTGPWQIVDGEGSQYKSFVYMFDGTTKSVLMTGSVGQMAVYSVSDETDDSAPRIKRQQLFKDLLHMNTFLSRVRSRRLTISFSAPGSVTTAKCSTLTTAESCTRL